MRDLTTEEVHKLAEDLCGSGQSLDDSLLKLFALSFAEVSIKSFDELDYLTFKCATCGWWCEPQEESEESEGDEQICNDCYNNED